MNLHGRRAQERRNHWPVSHFMDKDRVFSNMCDDRFGQCTAYGSQHCRKYCGSNAMIDAHSVPDIGYVTPN